MKLLTRPMHFLLTVVLNSSHNPVLERSQPLSLLNVSNQVSHTYKSADKVMALCRISVCIIIKVVCPIRCIEETGKDKNVVLEKQPRENC
jgi:hypothetical protein